MEALARYVAGHAAAARPLRALVALLTEAAYPLDELVRETALPRRTVEEVLAALGADLVDGRIRPDLVPAYRARFGYAQLRATALTDPLAARLADAADLVGDARALIAAAPRPAAALDHVSATATTAVRRALWLDSVYDLAGAHLLCLGDHDLTALLVAAVNPEVTVTVVDLDERVLAYVDSVAVQRKYRIRCLFADLRFGLPAAVSGRADLVFTDPPYTPDGVRLFLARGLRALRDREHGRLLMAYGYSARHPALGWQVQQAAAGLGLVYEAVLPGFSRYLGAQAVGSASDLYVCRPTARAAPSVPAPSVPAPTAIYTHGAQSTEATVPRADPGALCALAGPGAVLAEPGPVLTSARTFTGPVALDLSADPGPWLPRVLLAVNAVRVAALVPNRHPDVSSAAGQTGLARLVGPKYRLTYLRNTPDNRSTVVLADRVDAGPDLVRHILDRAHGKVANVWRDGLVALGLTRAAAAALVDADPDVSLLDLPRHRIAALLDRMAESAQATASATSTLPRIAAE